MTALGKRIFLGSCQALLAAVTAAAAVDVNAQLQGPVGVQGQPTIQFGMGWGWPYDPSLWQAPFYPGYYWSAPCYPFVSCAEQLRQQMLDRRRQRMEELGKQDERTMPPVGIDTWGGLPANQRRRAEAPRTPDEEVQPGYENRGEVRPEYSRTGDFLPEFLEGRVRPLK